MQIKVPTAKPRNPLVALGLRRRAGSHRPSTKSERQALQRTLRQEIRLAPP